MAPIMSTVIFIAMLSSVTLETNGFLTNLLNSMNQMSPFNPEFMEPGEGAGFGLPGMGGSMMGNPFMRNSIMGRGGGGMFNPMHEMSDNMRDMHRLMTLLRRLGMGGKAKTQGTPSAKTVSPPPTARPSGPRRQRRPSGYCMFCLATRADCAQKACMYHHMNTMF